MMKCKKSIYIIYLTLLFLSGCGEKQTFDVEEIIQSEISTEDFGDDGTTNLSVIDTEDQNAETTTDNAEVVIDEQEPANNTQYRLGNVVNSGKDKGYSLNDAITYKDSHYGWELGKFFVTGYTRVTNDSEGNCIFLKNVGDQVGLYFNLNQSIDALNGDSALSIAKDANGYDSNFQVAKQDFGRGTMIIRHTDAQNLTETQVYTDYLSGVSVGADTTVELCEEGDYEVALDYEIIDSPHKVLGKDVFPSYADYSIRFKFSVRNGNTMAFLCDVKNGSELINSSYTADGFYIDWAKSKYLEIDVKKEVIINATTGEKDVRFNRPAQDGEKYTDEGIYTVTVRNKYTNTEPTTKVIYVGEGVNQYAKG